MKKYWTVIGVSVITAAALYYPAKILYKYLVGRGKDNDEGDGHLHVKAFSPTYRGKHNPHHRQPHNGTTD